MKKASKIIFSLILLSICVGGIFLYHNNEEIKRQYNIGVQETQDAFRDFNNLVLSLLENQDQDIDFETFSNSFTSLEVSMSYWAPIFADVAENKELPYNNATLSLEGTVSDISIDIKTLYHGIVHMRYLQDNSSHTYSQLVQLHKKIQDQMNIILVKW